MTLLEIFGVKESYQLPTAIMDKIHNGDITDMVKKMRENGITDLRDYYQSEQGDRKSLKQDFTPDCICEIVASLTKEGTCLDMCAGTGALAKRDVEFRFEKNEVHFTRALDSQRPLKKAIFGAGFLISDKKATKLKGAKRTIIREKIEKAEKIYWKLSDREKEIIKNLG